MSSRKPTRRAAQRDAKDPSSAAASGFNQVAAIQLRALANCMDRRMKAIQKFSGGPLQASLAHVTLMQEDAVAFRLYFEELAEAAFEMNCEVTSGLVRYTDAAAVLQAAHVLD